MEQRKDLIQRVETFLQQPTVQNIDYETKKQFLLQKGLTENEIKKLLPNEIIEISPFWKKFAMIIGVGGSCIGLYYLFKNYIFPWWKKKRSGKK